MIAAPEALTGPPAEPTPGEPPAEGMGEVTSNVGRGALLVQHEDGRQFRLSWGEQDDPEQAKEDHPDRRGKAVVDASSRSLPSGRYFLRGFRMIRENKAGERWFLSATGQDLKRFQVSPGRTTAVEVPDRVEMSHKAMQVRNQVKVSLGLRTLQHGGVSLYRDGTRVPLECSLLDGRGKVVATSTAAYG